MNKTAIVIRTILLIIISAAFLMSAYGKFTADPTTVQMFEALDLAAFRNALGIIEVIIVLALWWRRTRMIGTLIASAYLGGAIASDLSLGGIGIVPALVLGMTWISLKLSRRAHGCHACKNGTCPIHTEKCGCKEGCDCAKGACNC